MQPGRKEIPRMTELSDRTVAAPARRREVPEWLRVLGFRRLSIVYVEILAVIIFLLWVPKTFAATATVTGILDQNAITGLVALALVVPLAAGVFDLSIGFALGATSIFCVWLLGNTSFGVPAVVALSVLFAACIGCVNGFVVVTLRIDSFIGTLATGSLLQSAILIISGDQDLTTGITRSFLRLGTSSAAHITVPVFVMLAVTLAMWYVLNHTALGRHVHATGLSEVPARLAGVRTDRIRFCSLVISATVAGIAGILLAAVVSAGDPSVGPSYLIPAFAAAFLGATQFRDRLFNAWGTVFAVWLLGTIISGLALTNAPLWMPYVFQGVVLIIALSLGSWRGRSIRLRWRRLRPQPGLDDIDAEAPGPDGLAPNQAGRLK
jgi:ribose transport system permease protein